MVQQDAGALVSNILGKQYVGAARAGQLLINKNQEIKCPKKIKTLDLANNKQKTIHLSTDQNNMQWIYTCLNRLSLAKIPQNILKKGPHEQSKKNSYSNHASYCFYFSHPFLWPDPYL